MDPTKSLSISTEESHTIPEGPAHITDNSENMDNKPPAEVIEVQEKSESNTKKLLTEKKETDETDHLNNNSSTATHHDLSGWGFPNNMHPYMQFFSNPPCYPFQFPPYNMSGCNNSNNANVVTTHEHSQPSVMQVPTSDPMTHSRSVPNNPKHTQCPFPPPYGLNSMCYQPLPVVFCAGHHLNNPNPPSLKSNFSPVITVPLHENKTDTQTISNFKIPYEITSFIDDLGRNWTCLDTDSCKGNKETGKILTRKPGKITNSTAKKTTSTRSESRRVVTPSEESTQNITEGGSASRRFKVKCRESSPNDHKTRKSSRSKSKRSSKSKNSVDSNRDSTDSCAAEYRSIMSLPKSRNCTKESKKEPISSNSDGKFENRTRSLSWGSKLELLAKNNVKRLQSELITSRNNFNDVSDDDVDENQPTSNPSLNKAYYRPNLTRIIKNSLNRLEARKGAQTFPSRCGAVIPAENLHPRPNNGLEPAVRVSKKTATARKSRQSSRTREPFDEETDDSTSTSLSDSDDDVFANVRLRRQNTNSLRNDDLSGQRRSDNNDWDEPKPHSILKKLKKIQSDGLFQIPKRSHSPRSGNENKKVIQDEPRTLKARTVWNTNVGTEETNRFCQCQNYPTYQSPQWSMNDSPDPMSVHHHADIAPTQSTSHSPMQHTSNTLIAEDYSSLNNNTLLNTLNNANLFHRAAFGGRLSNADRPLEENRYRNNILRRAAFNVENLADFRVSNNDRLGRLESQLFRMNGRGPEMNNFENNLQLSLNGGGIRRVRLCPTPRNQNSFDLLTPHLEINHNAERRLDDNLRAVRSIRRPSIARPRTPRNGGHTSNEETARQNWMELERVTYRRPRSANTVRKNPVTKRNPKLAEEFNRIQNSDFVMKLKENLVKADDSTENTEVGEGQEFQENDENNRECECEEEQEEQGKNPQPEQEYEDEF